MPTIEEVAERYDRGAAAYDERHDRRGAAARVRADFLDGLQLAAVGSASRVLEIGCGTGRLLARVRAPVRVGVDVSTGMLGRAMARGLSVVRADAHLLPFEDGSFDGILAGKGVFRYLDRAAAFSECARVLSPGGMLALHQYGSRTWTVRGRPADAPPGTWHVGYAEDVADPARRAGFTVCAFHRFRTIRLRPYLLRIPAWLDGRVQLWNHCVVVLRLRTAARDRSRDP